VESSLKEGIVDQAAIRISNEKLKYKNSKVSFENAYSLLFSELAKESKKMH